MNSRPDAGGEERIVRLALVALRQAGMLPTRPASEEEQEGLIHYITAAVRTKLASERIQMGAAQAPAGDHPGFSAADLLADADRITALEDAAARH